jgi:hypothetical protein
MPLSIAMSERAELVHVRALAPQEGSSSPESARWRRRTPANHSVRQPLRRAAPPPPCRVASVPPPRERRRASRRAWVLGAVLLSGAGWAATLFAQAQLGDATFSGRIQAGCEDLAPCQSLEAEAEHRLEQCRLFCGRAAAEYKTARLMRYRSEERRAVRDHYRERDRVERLEEEHQHAQKLDEMQRREAARVEEAAREQRERLQLESLRQEHIDRRIADERQRRAAYYSALGPEGRALRLKRCLGNAEHCDGLVLDLLDAARDDAERRHLAELNEGVVPPPPPPPKAKHADKGAPATPSASAVPPASAPEVDATEAAARQHAVPDPGTDAAQDRPSS